MSKDYLYLLITSNLMMEGPALLESCGCPDCQAVLDAYRSLQADLESALATLRAL